MPLQIIDESYNSLPALYANAGKYVSATVKFRNAYRFGSGNSNKVTTFSDSIQMDSGNWHDYGFSDGDTVTFYLRKLTGPPPQQFVTFTRTISYCNGNQMYFTAALDAAYQYKVLPTSGVFSGVFIRVNKQPKSVDFRFNLALSGTTGLDSIIDQELNRFINNAVDGLAVSGSVSLTQMNNKSGGLVESVTITRNADTTFTNSVTNGTATEYNYTIAFTFVQWGIFKDSNDMPSWYFAANCLSPIIEINTFPQVNTANGKLTAKNGAQNSNTGWFGENYNGYPAAYTFTSFDVTDLDGNPLEQIPYNQSSLFTAVFATPNQSNGNSNYRIGMAFTPMTETLYKNLPTNWKNNVLLNAPNLDYQHSASPDTTNRVGNTNTSGAGFDFDDLMFSHSANVLTVTGKIIPTASSEAFFDSLADGDRNLMAWVQVSDYTKTGQLNDEVNVLFYNDDCYNAPRIGVQYPGVVSDKLYDHSGLDVTATTYPNTTTEDNILYVGKLRVETDTEIDGITVGIVARNSVTGESFTLESTYFDFTNIPFVSGVYVPNETINRNFLLPPTSDRNIIRLTRDTTTDTGTKYGLKLEYGFLNRWQYWLEQSNVNDEFFDTSEEFNGKNKNWQRLQNGDWGLSVAYFVRVADVDDFNYTPFIDRPYEDDNEVSTVVTYTDANGDDLTALPSSGIVNVNVKFNWNQNFAGEWAEATFESVEGSRIGFISTVLEHDGQGGNCLLPEVGQTKLQKTIGTNQLTINFRVDCSQLPITGVSETYRCYSEPKEDYGNLITFRKDATLAYSIFKVSSDEVWDGALLTIERLSDGNHLDVYATSSGLIDTEAMADFASGTDARIYKFWDQSGNGLHATQASYANMFEIVKAGAVYTDSDNGLPTWVSMSAAVYYDLTFALNQGEEFTQVWVCNRKSFNELIPFGNVDGEVTLQWLSNTDNNVHTEFGPGIYDYGANTTTGTMLITSIHKVTDLSYYQINGVNAGSIAGDVTVVKNHIYFNRTASDHGNNSAQEIIVWQKDKTPQIANINQNIIDRYGL